MRGWKSTYIKDGIWEVGNDKVASLSDMAAGKGEDDGGGYARNGGNYGNNFWK